MIAIIATEMMRMLRGQVAMPRMVSGVATPPIIMPSAMKKIRVAIGGTCIERPASAATATNISEPAIQPAGKPK